MTGSRGRAIREALPLVLSEGYYEPKKGDALWQ